MAGLQVLNQEPLQVGVGSSIPDWDAQSVLEAWIPEEGGNEVLRTSFTVFNLHGNYTTDAKEADPAIDAGKATTNLRRLRLEILDPDDTEKPIGDLKACIHNGCLGIANRSVADCAEQKYAEDVDIEDKHGFLHGQTWASKLPKISPNMGGLRLEAESMSEEVAKDVKKDELLREDITSEEVSTDAECGHEEVHADGKRTLSRCMAMGICLSQPRNQCPTLPTSSADASSLINVLATDAKEDTGSHSW